MHIKVKGTLHAPHYDVIKAQSAEDAVMKLQGGRGALGDPVSVEEYMEQVRCRVLVFYGAAMHFISCEEFLQELERLQLIQIQECEEQ